MKSFYTGILFIVLLLWFKEGYSQSPTYSYTPNLITNNTIPLSSTSNLRQNLYYPTDFNAPSGMVSKIYIGAGTATSPTYSPLTIKVGPTTLNTFTSGPFITGLTTVFSGNITLTSVNGWYEVNLTTPFFYSNTQNLIIEISQGGFSNTAATPMASSTAVPSTTNRTLYGTIVSGTGNVQPRLMKMGFSLIPNDNDLAGLTIVQPQANSQHCPTAPLVVRTSIRNMGAVAQSNFPVNAYYTGAATGTLTTMYTGTLAPGVIDNVDFPATSFQPGTYNIRAVPALATDTLHLNDTTPSVSFVIKPHVNAPTAFSDTVCLGNNALPYVDAQPNTTYNWYSALTGGTLLTSGNTVVFSPLVQDTVMYVSALSNGCESGRVPITAVIGPAPTVKLPADTSFCESIPLILDAGNPGGTYLWSTGDTVQSIGLTNQSGTFWVTVDKYCIASDTVNVTIAPLPMVSGISYVRMDRTYYFTPSSEQHVQNYLWIFGDGATSTLRDPVHIYAMGHTSALNAQLIVSNDCGTDSVLRVVPTNVPDIQSQENIGVYPNPASETVNITAEKAAISGVVIIDMIGKTVLQLPCSGSHKEAIDVSRLAAGNYIVRINTDSGHATRKLEIRR